jgi:translation initiation factor 2B subunit (eIF-2B alpha/beta/delta family)
LLMPEENSNAGTPPAEQGGNEPQNEGKLTQAEVDAIVADRLARERKKYANYSELKKASEELAELKKSQMTEVEKLKAELAEKDALLQSKDQELSSLKLERVKAAKLAEAGVAAEWIDSVSGTTEEEVAASVTKLAARLKVEPPKAAQGAGQTGIHQEKKNTKIWTQSEIKELRLSGRLTDEVMAEIKQATAEGRVQ